jgi:hypothetical protein
MAGTLPAAALRSDVVLSLTGHAARCLLGPAGWACTARPQRAAPQANPRHVWAVADSREVLDGVDLRAPGPLPRQGRLGARPGWSE